MKYFQIAYMIKGLVSKILKKKLLQVNNKDKAMQLKTGQKARTVSG